MTGFDLGQPDAPQRGELVLNRLRAGAIPSVAGRGLLQMEEEFGEGLTKGTLGGIATATVKGMADASYGLLKGAEWLLTNVPAAARGKTEAVLPATLMDALPRKTRLSIESRLAQAGSFGRPAGETLGLGLSMLGGGASAVGKAVTLPGKAVHALGVPGMKIAERLLRASPEAGKWARAAAKHVPGLVGASTGFGLYNYVTAEGGFEERAAAALHGIVVGGGLHILGTVGRALDGRILSRMVSETEAKQLMEVANGLRTKADINILKKIPGRVLSSAFEGTAFAGMDKQFLSDVIRGAQGDDQAAARAAGVWAGSFAGALAAKYGQPDAYLFFSRTAPHDNTLQTRLDAYQQADQERVAKDQGEPQEPGKEQFKAQEDQRIKAGMEDATRTVDEMPALRTISDPLFKSGWEMVPEVKRDGMTSTVTLDFPGGGKVELSEDGGSLGAAVRGFSIKVPAEVYRQVRGDGPAEGWARLSGPAAEEFARDLGALSMLRRIRGELLFGGDGKEAWAGGPWRDGEGKVFSVGLDGNVYSRDEIHNPGEQWKQVEAPEIPSGETGVVQNPEIVRWMELAAGLRANAAPNPGLDLIDAALTMAIRGRSSPSHRELLNFLATPMQQGVPNADAIAPLLTPETTERLGMLVGQLASGHMNAETARQQMAQVFAPQQPQKLLGFAEGQEPKGDVQQEMLADSQVKLDEIAGAKDWNSAEPAERRSAARQYAEEARDAGVEVAPSKLTKTFAVPKSTARDILAKAQERRTEEPPKQTGEEGFALKVGPEQMAQIGMEADRLARSPLNPKRFYRPMTKEVAKSGPVGKEIAQRALQAVDLTKERIGKLNKLTERTLEEASGMGFVGKQSREAKRWAEHVSYDEQGRGEANFKLTVEGKGVDVPDVAQRWADTYRGTRYETGVMAKEARTIRKVKSTEGEAVEQLFEPAPREANIFVREMHPEMAAVLKAGGKRRDELAQAIATYGRNNIDPELLKREWSKKVQGLETKEAFEFVRELPDLFSHFKFSDGAIIKVLETSPYETIKNMAQQGATRSAVIQAIGQEGVSDKTRQELGLPPGPETLQNRLLEEGGRADVGAELFRNLNAMGADTVAWLPKPLRKLETLRRVAQILKSAPLDLVEGLSTIPQFTGFRDALVGMVRGGMNGKEIKAYLEEIGAITIEAGHHLMVEDTGMVGYLTQKLGLPKQLAADAGAVMAGASALHVLKRWGAKESRPRDVLALERMEFTSSEIADLTTGAASQALKNTFVRRFVANSTGQFLRGERSQMGASAVVNLLLPYNRYFMNRFRQFVETTAQTGREVRRYRADRTPENKARAIAAAGQSLRFMLGAAVSGSIGIYLSNLMVDGAMDAWDQVFHEASKDPLEFAARAARSSWLGGVPGALYGVVADQSIHMTDRLERVSPDLPLSSVVSELMMASASAGQYKGETFQEKVGTFALRMVPALRDMDFLAGWVGFDVSPETQGAIAALTRWKRITGKQSAYAGTDQIEDEDVARWRAMRDLSRKVRKASDSGITDLKNDPSVIEAVNATLDATSGKSLAASLRGKKLLARLDPDEMNDLAEREGQDVLRRLQAHDDALEAVAATYARVPKNLAGAERDMDLGTLLDVATSSAKNQNPRGFRAAYNAIEDVVDARRAAKLPLPKEEINRLAQVMADFPEVAGELFTTSQRKELSRIKDTALLKVRMARLLRERLTGGDRPPTAEKARSTTQTRR